MKGIIINEGSPLLENKYVNACYIKYGDLSIQLSPGNETLYSLSGATDKRASACCSKNDTYDFETGALIALMKMCGLEKSAKAYAEIFDDTAYGDALIEMDKLKGELRDLKKDSDKVIDELIEENKRLKGESESHWKKYQRNVQKKQDRINELEAQVIASEDDKQKNIEYYEKEIKRLTEKVDSLYSYNKSLIDEIDQKNHEIISLKALKISNEVLKKDNESFRKTCEKLKDELRLKEDAINEWKQTLREQNTKIGDLVCENEKLKMDCEKLQHGYIDTDNAKPYPDYWDGDILDIVFISGRACGKQYKALVNLFKKLPQDKIEAAYKEVFNTELPAWKKEFLNTMYGIYQESMKKEELPRTLDINGATYRKCDEKGRVVWMTSVPEIKPLSRNSIDEFAFKPASKREKMWDYILKEGRTPVYVKRKDIHDFLEECQIAGIKWQSGKMPLETIPFDLIEPTDAGIYFFVMTSRTPNEFRHVMTWWVTAYNEDERKAINYLPPMRWDLFKKGRLVVKVSKENYAEFCSRVFSHFDKVGVNAFNHDCKFGYFMFNKDTDYVERILASDCGDTKEINGHKVVDWEDVR